MTKISRRDFLKLSSIASLTANSQLNLAKKSIIGSAANKPNILFVLFDTLSAKHISLYGYGRKTMPFLEKFAESATVYHNHFSPGNYTMPGTSSLLTSTYPWTHRGLHLRAGVKEEFVKKNMFSEFSKAAYYTLSFSHNQLANYLLSQFMDHIDNYLMPDDFAILDRIASDAIFRKDFHIFSQAEKYITPSPRVQSISLFFRYFANIIFNNQIADTKREMRKEFPLGLPQTIPYSFTLEDTIDWMLDEIEELSRNSPYLGYFHLWPPHAPYRPRKKFYRKFKDATLNLPNKPKHFFESEKNRKFLVDKRRVYDEFILNVDFEFDRLHNYLQDNDLLDNTWLIFTSDHGEMFERGVYQHNTPVLYNPLIHVPLLIKAPGQTERIDIHTATSSVDILPTLLQIAGEEIPTWTEGQVLPPYRQNQPEQERIIYAMEAKSSPKYGPLHKASFASIRWPYKLIYYRGYKSFDEVYELYNLELDPEELDNLIEKEKVVFVDLKKDLLTKIEKADEPYA